MFTVIAKNLSKENKYVKSVTLNGKLVIDWKISHSDIMRGAIHIFLCKIFVSERYIFMRTGKALSACKKISQWVSLLA